MKNALFITVNGAITDWKQ